MVTGTNPWYSSGVVACMWHFPPQLIYCTHLYYHVLPGQATPHWNLGEDFLLSPDLALVAQGSSPAAGSPLRLSPTATGNLPAPRNLRLQRRNHHGLGGPVFVQTEDPEELALAHRALGYRAAYCPPVKLADADRVRAIEQAYGKHDVVIAEIGVWNNLMEEDDAQRKKNVQANKEALALADEIGALCAVNITGSLSDQGWDAPDPANLSQEAFEICVMNARDILRAVKPKRAYFTYEMMPWAIPDCIEAYLALIDSVDNPMFGVHLDVANMVNSVRNYYFNTTSSPSASPSSASTSSPATSKT